MTGLIPFLLMLAVLFLCREVYEGFKRTDAGRGPKTAETNRSETETYVR